MNAALEKYLNIIDRHLKPLPGEEYLSAMTKEWTNLLNAISNLKGE